MPLKLKRGKDKKWDINYQPITLDISIIFQILAVLISWATHKSIGWAIIHGLFGFWYLIYWTITGDATESGVSEIYHYWKSILS